jgi:hypothetical protein
MQRPGHFYGTRRAAFAATSLIGCEYAKYMKFTLLWKRAA